MGRAIATIAGIMFAAGGCSVPARNATLDELQQSIPIGTHADVVVSEMLRKDYECRVVRDGEFTAWRKEPSGKIVEEEYAEIDFVRCGRRDNRGMVTNVHSVAFVVDDKDRVVQVLERWDFIGP